MSQDPTQRFTSRAEVYARYRPHYPPGVIDILCEECGLTPSQVVADVGSGTGLLSAVFLQHGNHVYGVEPNEAMRAAGEAFLRAYPHFTSVVGRAEATTLPTASVDLVAVAAAFHWFDPEQTRPEFARILIPGGWLVLVNNRRRSETCPAAQAVEDLMNRFGSGRGAHHRRTSDEALAAFFGPSGFGARACDNRQTLDREGLRGLLLSHSSAPEAGQAGHEELLAGVRELYERYQQDGQVTLDYETRVRFGRLGD